MAGVESTDGYTGTVPVTVAALLGIASVTAVRRLERSGDRFRIERMTEGGYDVYDCPAPALVTVTAGATEPRKQKPMERLGVADLGLSDVAPSQTVTDVVDAPPTSGGEIVQGEEAVGRIADLLAEAKVI